MGTEALTISAHWRGQTIALGQQRPATETCHSKQPCVPAAEDGTSWIIQGLPPNTVDRQVDSIVDPILDLDIQSFSLTTGGGDLENFQRLFSKLKEMNKAGPSSWAKKDACRKGGQSLLDGNWGRQRWNWRPFIWKSTKLFMLGLADSDEHLLLRFFSPQPSHLLQIASCWLPDLFIGSH